MLTQGLSLLVHRSDLCRQVVNPYYWLTFGGMGLDNNFQYTEEVAEFEQYITASTAASCSRGPGSKMAVSAVIMWFLAAITCYWNVKKVRDI